MQPSFSIIIPVYNAGKYLLKTLESVKDQGFTDFEVLLVDDGSTDNSVSIIQQYIKKYSNITVINKKNGGVSSARNVKIKRR